MSRSAPAHRVILVDSRGHGRSTRDQRPFGYDLMADDVVALLDTLKIDKAAIIGWSDGGIIGLDIAMRHPERVTRVFAFGANTSKSGLKEDFDKNPTFAAYIERAGREYAQLSATPDGVRRLSRADRQDVGRRTELDRCAAPQDSDTGVGGGRRARRRHQTRPYRIYGRDDSRRSTPDSVKCQPFRVSAGSRRIQQGHLELPRRAAAGSIKNAESTSLMTVESQLLNQKRTLLPMPF